jgi:hypothetical protein
LCWHHLVGVSLNSTCARRWLTIYKSAYLGVCARYIDARKQLGIPQKVSLVPIRSFLLVYSGIQTEVKAHAGFVVGENDISLHDFAGSDAA